MNGATCNSHVGKVGYATTAQAHLARRRIRSAGRSNHQLRVYRCTDCRFYFLTSDRPRAERMRLIREQRLAARESP